jgi:hypothetical protein
LDPKFSTPHTIISINTSSFIIVKDKNKIPWETHGNVGTPYSFFVNFTTVVNEEAMPP